MILNATSAVYNLFKYHISEDKEHITWNILHTNRSSYAKYNFNYRNQADGLFKVTCSQVTVSQKRYKTWRHIYHRPLT